jgi:hypothetical protein
LIISYLVPVLAEAVDSRRLAHYLSSLGETPAAALQRGWNGRDFAPLVKHLQTVTPVVALLGQRYLAYPVVFYFSAISPRRPSASRLPGSTRRSRYLSTGSRPRRDRTRSRPLARGDRPLPGDARASGHPPRRHAPILGLDALQCSGIPTVNRESYAARVDERAERRKLLLALVRSDGWHWEALEPASAARAPSG